MTELKNEILNNWQNIVELLAKVLDVSCVAITEHDNKYLKIVKTNKSEENPFKDGMMPEKVGLYCASVINSKKLMQIPNIKKDDYWKDNPYADNGLISYLGYPIFKHDGDIFGTICVLDNRERVHPESTVELLKEFKIIIEKQLENIYLSDLTHSILDSLNSAIVMLDDDNVIKYNNKLWPEFINTAGIELGHKVIGANYEAVSAQLKSTEGQSVYEGIKKVASKETDSFVSDYQIENTNRWCWVKITPFIGGGDYKVVIMHEDITEVKEMEEEMTRNRVLFQQLFDRSPDPIALLDVDGKIVNVNRSFEARFGYSAEEAAGKLFSQLMDSESEEINEAEISKVVLTGESTKGETKCKTKQGMELYIYITINPFFVKNKIAGAFAIYVDITEKKREEEMIKFLSYHDQLTQLYNRRYFDHEVKRIDNETNLPISIIIGDLDKLKTVNDSFGHAMGDQYIIESAKTIRSVLRKSDLVARIGGDEFGIILPNTDESTAQKIVEIIQEKVNSENQNRNPAYSISLGTATKSDINTDIATVIKNADDVMYRNKGVPRR